MCMKDLVKTLRDRGIDITESQVRWALNSGKISRPPMDGLLRFVFGEAHLANLTLLYPGGIGRP